MTLLYSIFFGAGIAAFAYSTIARRVGYGNNQNVVVLVGAIFIISAIVFYTILSIIGLK